jgi:hypothetical protein
MGMDENQGEKKSLDCDEALIFSRRAYISNYIFLVCLCKKWSKTNPLDVGPRPTGSTPRDVKPGYFAGQQLQILRRVPAD